MTLECTPTKRWPPGAAAVAPESADEPALDMAAAGECEFNMYAAGALSGRAALSI